jgi:hypothetical protein
VTRRRQSHGLRSHEKGRRTEVAIARLLQANGFAGGKVSMAYKPGADIRVRLLGVDRALEVKYRAASFRRLCDRLNQSHMSIVKEYQQEPLVVLRMPLVAEIAEETAA